MNLRICDSLGAVGYISSIEISAASFEGNASGGHISISVLVRIDTGHDYELGQRDENILGSIGPGDITRSSSRTFGASGRGLGMRLFHVRFVKMQMMFGKLTVTDAAF